MFISTIQWQMLVSIKWLKERVNGMLGIRTRAAGCKTQKNDELTLVVFDTQICASRYNTKSFCTQKTLKSMLKVFL